jgi:hypothetical protein
MLPDGVGGLDCSDLCDMGHHSDICQVHDMFETSGMVSSYYLCNKNIYSQELVLSCIPFKLLANVLFLNGLAARIVV